MKILALTALLAFGACTFSCSSDHERQASSDASRTIVSGTVLDRTSGELVADAHVRLPDGSEGRTDAHGRFHVEDVAVGLSGELVVRADDGREGRVTLRPLGRRPLEVVVYVGR